MANNAFDRTNIGLRERPVSADLNRNISQADRSLRDTLMYLLSARSLTSAAGVPYTGFIGDGLRVVPTSPIGMSVQLTAGLGFYYTPIDLPVDLGALDFEAVDDRSAFKPMVLTAPQSFAVPAAPTAGNSRIDIIEARFDRRLEDPQVRRQLDASSKIFDDHIFYKTLSFTLDGQVGTVNSPSPSTAALGYKIGAVATTGTEIEPSITPGYVKVSTIHVASGVSSIDVTKLSDQRPLIVPGGVIRASVRFQLQWNAGVPTVTILDTNAPPGVEILVKPTTPIGTATLGIIAGQISHATVGYQSVDAASTSKILALLNPTVPTTGGIAVAPNAISVAFSRPVTQGGAITGVIHGLITPGSPANIDFAAAGLGNLICTAEFTLMA